MKALIGHGFFRPTDSSKVSGVYELLLKQRMDSALTDCFPRVADTSLLYVRGEENLQVSQHRLCVHSDRRDYYNIILHFDIYYEVLQQATQNTRCKGKQ